MSELIDISAVELAVSPDANDSEAWETLVRVNADGAVQIHPRFTDEKSAEFTLHQLNKTAVNELFEGVLCTENILSIDVSEIASLTRVADARLSSGSIRSLGMSSFEDGVYSIIRLYFKGIARPREWMMYHLAGTAMRYPNIEQLQRLRRIELQLLELATVLTAQ